MQHNQKCINFDWVQVWTYEPTWISSADSFRAMGWIVKERSFGTRIFEDVLTLIDKHGIPFVEVCRRPKSRKSQGGIINDKATSIRLVNQACYSPKAIQDLITFLQDCGYHYKHDKLAAIQRIDLCIDFTKFDVLKDSPQLFVNDYMTGKYSKVTQPRVRAIGIDGYTFKRYNSLSWGSPTSMVSTKMYCKTQEMAEVKEKPWIRQAWVDSGILANSLDETPVWRIEFKITGECHEWIDEDGVIIHNTLDSMTSEVNIMAYMKGLIDHYFDFRIVNPNESKYKANKVDMWRWPKGVTRALPRRKEHFRDTGRAELILLNKLDRLRDTAGTITDLASIKSVKDMVLNMYYHKKNDTPTIPPHTTKVEYDRVQDILQALQDTTDVTHVAAIEDTSAQLAQLWHNLHGAMEREVLWKSLFPSSSTGVHLSDFLIPESPKGWFVVECNGLKQSYLQLTNETHTTKSLMQIYNEIAPEQRTREIEQRKWNELYYKNEILNGHTEPT